MTAVVNAPYFIAIHLFFLLFFIWRSYKGDDDKLIIWLLIINFVGLFFNMAVLLVNPT